MKKIFLVLFVSIICSTSFAQFGNITVSSNSNQKFWLFIDDVLQNEYSTHLIRIQGMQLSYYKIRVEMDNPSNNCVGQTVLISNAPNGNHYVVSKDRSNNFKFERSYATVNPYFIQNIILPDYSCFSAYNQFLFPGFHSNANYGQGNQFRGNAYKKYQYNSQGYGNQGYGNPPGHGNPPPYGNPPGHGNPPAYGNPGGGMPPQGGCMPQTDFNRAVSIIQKESFENSKLEVAKQMTSNNRLCVAQIIQICRIFSFENTKLEYAKYAYWYCVDKHNYYQLNEVFTYSSSKDQLRDFIDNKY